MFNGNASPRPHQAYIHLPDEDGDGYRGLVPLCTYYVHDNYRGNEVVSPWWRGYLCWYESTNQVYRTRKILMEVYEKPEVQHIAVPPPAEPIPHPSRWPQRLHLIMSSTPLETLLPEDQMGDVARKVNVRVACKASTSKLWSFMDRENKVGIAFPGLDRHIRPSLAEVRSLIDDPDGRGVMILTKMECDNISHYMGYIISDDAFRRICADHLLNEFANAEPGTGYVIRPIAPGEEDNGGNEEQDGQNGEENNNQDDADGNAGGNENDAAVENLNVGGNNDAQEEQAFGRIRNIELVQPLRAPAINPVRENAPPPAEARDPARHIVGLLAQAANGINNYYIRIRGDGFMRQRELVRCNPIPNANAMAVRPEAQNRNAVVGGERRQEANIHPILRPILARNPPIIPNIPRRNPNFPNPNPNPNGNVHNPNPPAQPAHQPLRAYQQQQHHLIQYGHGNQIRFAIVDVHGAPYGGVGPAPLMMGGQRHFVPPRRVVRDPEVAREEDERYPPEWGYLDALDELEAGNYKE